MKNLYRSGWRRDVFSAVAMVAIATIHVVAQTSDRQSSIERARYFCGRGEIVSLDEDRLSAIIKHERIEGFMEAMTMRFKAEDGDVLKHVSPGERVRFTLKDTPTVTRLVYIEKIEEKK
jgi:Cu/Ag efflux protein CusF